MATVVSVAIQKGGSGKTTTALNLAAALHRQGKAVLLVDLDPQANLTQSLGYGEPQGITMYQLLRDEGAGLDTDYTRALIQIREGFDLLPAALELAMSEVELVSIFGRERLLSRILAPALPKYDFVFIDCPPAVGMLTVNALAMSQLVLMPLQAEFLPLKGVKSFHDFTLARVKKQLNPDIELLGIVLTRYDERKTMNREVLQQLEATYPGKVFDTRIRTNIALARAQELGTDIFTHDDRSNGAEDYRRLAAELIDRMKKTKR
ncbi:MAG: ParA family protein [Saprospiraceae bacterium]